MRLPKLTSTVALLALAAACATQPQETPTPSPAEPPAPEKAAQQLPAEPPPFSGGAPDADNKAVLDAQLALGARPIHTLSPPEAREQPTPADGVKALLQQQGKPATPPPGIATQDITYKGAAGELPARVYRPEGAKGPLPVIAYFHGGGWVIADIDVYDASARGLARETQAMVVSFEYRRAPEDKFPAAHEDAVAAYRWLTQNAASIGGDPRRLALAGESAGGNLALNVAIAARDGRLTPPLHQLLIYPAAGTDPLTPSYKENANARPLNRAGMFWFLHHATQSPTDAKDPRLNLIAAKLEGLPPATVIAAEIDPLTSEGEALTERLRAAGVAVERRAWAGATHEFFGMDAVVADAQEAQKYAGERLREALQSPPAVAAR